MTGLAAVLCPALLCNLLSGCGTVQKAKRCAGNRFSGSGTAITRRKYLFPSSRYGIPKRPTGFTVDFNNISSGYFVSSTAAAIRVLKSASRHPDGDKYYFMPIIPDPMRHSSDGQGTALTNTSFMKNLSDDQYVAILSGQQDAAISDPQVTPYLYPNQWILADTRAVAKGAELVKVRTRSCSRRPGL